MSLRSKLILSFLSISLITVIVCVLGYINTRELVKSGNESTTIQNLFHRISNIQEMVLAVQLSEREFLVSGNDNSLDIFNTNRELIHIKFSDIILKIKNNDELIQKLSALDELIAKWYAEYAVKEISLRRRIDMSPEDRRKSSSSTESLMVEDVIDVHLLRDFQRLFTETTGIANLVVEADGQPVKQQSFKEFSKFCFGYIRPNEVGAKLCATNDKEGGEKALKTGKPAVYTCHAGLVDFGVPLELDGKLLGSWIGGQILTHEPDIEKFKEIAKKLKIKDMDGYLKAVKNVPVIPQERVEAAANFLSLFASMTSKLGNDLRLRKSIVEMMNDNGALQIQKTINLGFQEVLSSLSESMRTQVDAASEKADSVLLFFLIVVPVSLILTVILSLILSTGIVRQIIMVKDSYENIANLVDYMANIMQKNLVQGNWDCSFNMSRDDDQESAVGSNELNRELVKTCPDILKIFDSVEHSGKALNEVIDQMNATLSKVSYTSEDIKASAGQIYTTSEMLSTGASEQASAIEQISNRMVEISKSSNQNAQSASEATTFVKNISDAAGVAQKEMNRMTDYMSLIEENSMQIQKVVKTIDDIAFQTNLLALNAAVEAARAGQHGKGFAVVADEVRNLAARSAKSAAETSDLILKSNEQVKEGVSISQQTATSLQEISEQIMKTMSLVDSIAASSSEQANNVFEISKGLTQVEQVTHTTAASAEESSSASNDMNNLAETLYLLIKQFTLRDSSFSEPAYLVEVTNENRSIPLESE